ncbi:hypothetical protein Acr_00g0067810 [Actinidia rufa]|uniref:Uncharacterized protein n=1 Tax=Actinidia rufa TaxID=165716 RepID=A0A7J0DQJ6_9ERIC|nr:hypothetical protein Acr_00g0067810 [Actinidia rufa]
MDQDGALVINFKAWTDRPFDSQDVSLSLDSIIMKLGKKNIYGRNNYKVIYAPTKSTVKAFQPGLSGETLRYESTKTETLKAALAALRRAFCATILVRIARLFPIAAADFIVRGLVNISGFAGAAAAVVQRAQPNAFVAREPMAIRVGHTHVPFRVISADP